MRPCRRLWFQTLFAVFLIILASDGQCNSRPSAVNIENKELGEQGQIPGFMCDADRPAGTTLDSPEPALLKTAIKERMKEIADASAEEYEESIRSAFVHAPEELDALMVPLEFKDAVDHYITYFTTKKRKMFASWLKRAKRYTPLLKKILRENGLPEDLVYLAMIESGFNPKAYSRMKACGPWQFISATGERYGLRIDHWIDERRDFEKATLAAARYLKDLFERFDCWYLAASGYNAGEGRVQAAIRHHNTSNYWELYRYNTLPRETREYIPQLIAAATISTNPERYGFADTGEDEPFEFLKRRVPGGTPLYLVAEVAESDLSEIRALNPELMTRITPPGESRTVKLPSDADLDGFDYALRSRLKGKQVIRTVRLSSLRRRSLTRLLKRYGTTRKDLALVNRPGTPASSQGPIYIPVFEKPANALGTRATASAHRATAKKKNVHRLRHAEKKRLAKFHKSARGKSASASLKKTKAYRSKGVSANKKKLNGRHKSR